jgi:hypothetical protein
MEKMLGKLELELLQALIGQKFVCIAGDHIIPSLNSDSFFVKTQASTLAIWGDFAVEQIGDDEDDFSFFRIQVAENSATDALLRRGEATFRHTGEEITDISIGRLFLYLIKGDQRELVLVTDRSIILHLTKGELALSRRSLHLEMVEASFGDGADKPNIRKISTHYSPHDTEVFEISESLVSLKIAMEQVS